MYVHIESSEIAEHAAGFPQYWLKSAHSAGFHTVSTKQPPALAGGCLVKRYPARGIIMTFNPKQLRVLIAASVIFVIMGIFPPWTYTFNGESIHSEKPAGYGLIISPPKPEQDDGYLSYGIRLDITRLFVQWLVLFVATGGLLLLKREPG